MPFSVTAYPVVFLRVRITIANSMEAICAKKVVVADVTDFSKGIAQNRKAKYTKRNIDAFSAADLVQTQRRIVNPVRCRNGTATVCAETAHVTKVGHWENPEKAMCKLRMRESGDLLNDRKPCSFRVKREDGVLLHAEKRLRQSMTAAAFFIRRNL